jgi:hypothetical protein
MKATQTQQEMFPKCKKRNALTKQFLTSFRFVLLPYTRGPSSRVLALADNPLYILAAAEILATCNLYT